MSSALAIPVSLRRDDLLHFLGYPPERGPSERISRRIDEVLVEARALSAARGVWRLLPVAEAESIELESMPSAGLVIGIVTAGGAIEERTAERLRWGDVSGAMVLDAAGSAVVEEAADRLGAAIVAQLGGGDARACLAASTGREAAGHLSCRISPGYGRWQLSAQRRLFDRLPHAEVGVRLEESLLMTPRKSVSFAMWIGADARPVAGLSGCARCELEACRYRREARR